MVPLLTSPDLLLLHTSISTVSGRPRIHWAEQCAACGWHRLQNPHLLNYLNPHNNLTPCYNFAGCLSVVNFGASSWGCQRAGSILSRPATFLFHNDSVAASAPKNQEKQMGLGDYSCGGKEFSRHSPAPTLQSGAFSVKCPHISLSNSSLARSVVIPASLRNFASCNCDNYCSVLARASNTHVACLK